MHTSIKCRNRLLNIHFLCRYENDTICFSQSSENKVHFNLRCYVLNCTKCEISVEFIYQYLYRKCYQNDGTRIDNGTQQLNSNEQPNQQNNLIYFLLKYCCSRTIRNMKQKCISRVRDSFFFLFSFGSCFCSLFDIYKCPFAHLIQHTLAMAHVCAHDFLHRIH